MVQRFLARVDDLGLSGFPSLVGFSGGADSTALAIGVAEARRAGRLGVRLAHIEHRVRPDAGQDVTTVLSTAQRLGLPLSIRAIPDGAIAAHRGTGTEEAMRRERYLLLARVAEETACTSVLTAHHADDQAETVLGHLIRGSGLDGAAGIRPITTLMVPWWPSSTPSRPVVVIRPLLAERRHDVQSVLAGYGLGIVEDATNLDVDRTRAALRHRVLPVLEEIHPDAVIALARFADVARAELDERRPTLDTTRSRQALDRDSFEDTSVSAQRFAVRKWVADVTGLILTFERTEAIRRWVSGDGSGSVEIGGGWSILRAGRTISLHDDDGARRPTTR